MAEVLPTSASGFRIDSAAAARFGIALAQGVALSILFQVASRNWSPGIVPVSAPIALVLLTAPLILIQGWTVMPRATLCRWASAAAVIAAGLGIYDAWSRNADALQIFPRDARPTIPLMAGAVVALFVGQALITASASDNRKLARYGTYFDAATKQLVQMAAGVAFVVALWGSLVLGAQLFRLIGVTGFSRFLAQPWFAAPASTLALALAVHVTDVNAGLVRGLRTLALTLLSWLLPVMTAIVAAFVLTLPFTGLDGLWSTGFAASLLLAIVGTLVVLINATYQDGTRDLSRPIGVIARLAALLLTPVIIIAGYALRLRVEQYGWSGDRILALAVLIVGTAVAVGYAVAALSPGRTLGRIERINVGVAVLAVLVELTLLTPVLDPARIAVASQVARLHAGKIAPDKFDYAYLRFRGGRYGAEALAALQADPSSEIRAGAAKVESMRRPARR